MANPWEEYQSDSTVAEKPIKSAQEPESGPWDEYADPKETDTESKGPWEDYKPPSNDPSPGRIGVGLGTEVLAGEGLRVAGAAYGSTFGPLGTLAGYVAGAIGGGVVGSIAAQNIEGREDLSYGRIVADSLINLIPGSKVAKGGTRVARAVSAAGRQGAAGAVIAPAAQTVEGAIDEDKKLPDFEELGVSSLVGASLGSMLGVSSEAASGLYKKFAGKTSREIEDAVIKGDKDALKLTNGVLATADEADDVAIEGSETYFRNLGKFFASKVAPSFVSGSEVPQFARAAKGSSAAADMIGGNLGARIDKAWKSSSDPEGMKDAMNRFLDRKTNDLPPELGSAREALERGRMEIFRLQQRMFENHERGIRELPENLANRVRESITAGDYVTREYRFFENPSFRPSQKAREKLIKRLEKDMSRDEAEKFLTDLHNKRGDPDEAREFIMGNRAGILKEREDLRPELREYLGEITDPGERLRGTISKLGRMTAFDKADADIRDTFLRTGIAKRIGEGVDDINDAPLALRRGKIKDPDGNQLYVNKHVQRAVDHFHAARIDQGVQDTGMNVISDVFQSGIAVSKATKVLMNPPSYAVNLFGNMSGMTGMGMNPLKHAGGGFKLGFAQANQKFAKNLGMDDLGDLQRATELDLVQPGVVASDIRKGLQGQAVGRKIGEILEPLGKAYSIPDVALRIGTWRHYQSFLRKAAPELADMKNQRRLEELSAYFTNQTYQNYLHTSELAKTGARFGVLGQFATFSVELARNQYNQAKLATRMVSGKFADDLASEFGTVNRNAIRAEGLKRMGFLAGTYGAATAGAVMFNRMVGGVSEEEERRYRRSVLPEWDEHKELLLSKGEDGKIHHKNLSYVIPHAQMAEVGRAAMRGESFQKAFSDSMETLRENYLGELPFVLQSIVPAVGNYRPETGEPISKREGVESYIERAKWFVGDSMTPGIVREVNKVLEGQDPKITAARQAGIRIHSTTVEEGSGFKIRDTSDKLTSLSRDLARARYNPGENVEETYERLNETYKARFEDLRRVATDLRALGKSEDEVIAHLKDNGISGPKALLALDGETPDLPREERDTPSSRWEKMQDLSDGEKLRKIRGIEDRSMRESLMRKFRAERRRERRGVSERDRVVKSMGVDDGERASYIFGKMRRSDNPENVLREFMRKGVATKEVVRHIRLKQRARN